MKGNAVLRRSMPSNLHGLNGGDDIQWAISGDGGAGGAGRDALQVFVGIDEDVICISDSREDIRALSRHLRWDWLAGAAAGTVHIGFSSVLRMNRPGCQERLEEVCHSACFLGPKLFARLPA